MSRIVAIQVLRAIAALMIVLSHAQNDALNEALKAGVGFTRLTALPWDAGVDLFFVISGFIMVYSTQRLFATPGASRIFITRRLIRIVPLYWLITAISLLVLGYVAWLGRRAFPSLLEVASSLGFVPFARPGDGQPRPIAAQGWTLNYEMFFYLIFALFVGFRRDVAVACVAVTLALAVGIGAIVKPNTTALAYWSHPIVLEFVLGALTALAWQRGIRLKRSMVLPLIIVGLAALALDLNGMAKIGPIAVDPNGLGRLLACGLPMTLIFGASALAEPGFLERGLLSSSLILLGDASYALYLFHPIVIVLARKAYLALGLPLAIGFWPLVAVDIPMAAAFAVAIHVTVEKPVSVALQAWFRSKRSSCDSQAEPLLLAGAHKQEMRLP